MPRRSPRICRELGGTGEAPSKPRQATSRQQVAGHIATGTSDSIARSEGVPRGQAKIRGPGDQGIRGPGDKKKAAAGGKGLVKQGRHLPESNRLQRAESSETSSPHIAPPPCQPPTLLPHSTEEARPTHAGTCTAWTDIGYRVSGLGVLHNGGGDWDHG